MTLVTGCGRSGTRYATLVLRRLGLDIRHERLGKDGIASWALAVDAEDVPWGPSLRHLEFDVVLHQTRHPLAVVNSVMTFKERSWRFICAHVPVSLEDPLPLRAAAYWYYWNSEAERRADLTFAIERLGDAMNEICSRLGVSADSAVLDRVPRDVNTRRKGRAFHLAEELVERMGLDPVQWLRARLEHPPSDGAKVDWQDLRALDPELCERMIEKACLYGYEP